MQNGMLNKLCLPERINWNVVQLAKATGWAEDRIEAIMDVLASAGIVDRVRERTYVANNVTRVLNNPEQRRAIRKPRTKNWVVRARQGEIMRTFGSKNRIAMYPWFRIFPVEEELGKTDGGLKADRALLVDVAETSGQELLDFRKAFPSIMRTCVLEVLPEELEVTGKHLRDNGERRFDGLVKLLPHNILTDPQPVQGARIYLLNGVLHEKHDQDALKILKNTVDAMDGNYSRLLIVEKVALVLEAGQKFGVIRTPEEQEQRMCMERTEQQWTKLLKRAKLVIVQIWEGEGTESVIEAMVKQKEWL
ncbi:S-adenosyl-L-methionine-dependent methyltransferase [Viridothelium virens]|uniref:S-adenosyl-L-methionine-dependent methyltransferase n=1 Tax=Viridothelium virens TaxID=1048519 RepID=A0A6A6HEB9_VIRVR|nr:S-adenosyl-L-methionine-dependent methyltransferase [Viridothelium virens]